MLSSTVCSDDDSAKEDIGKVTTHLLEQGEFIKDCLNDQVQFNESWRNLGQTLESGLKLITELLDKIRPDPVQELCKFTHFNFNFMFSYLFTAQQDIYILCNCKIL